MSSAGVRSMAAGGCWDLAMLGFVVEERREIVKENSWEGDEDAEAGLEVASLFCC